MKKKTKTIKRNQWLEWARELEAMAQTGLTFSHGQYDNERFKRLMEIAAEITSLHTQLGEDEILKDFCMQSGYATPKVDVRAAIVRDDKILLVKERSDQCWCMPGGWADVGDVPSQAAIREVREESGFKVVAKRVVGVYDANRSGRPMEFYHAIKLVYFCEIIGGEATTSHETSAVEFFDFDHLPTLSINRTNEKHIRHARAFAEDIHHNTFFD